MILSSRLFVPKMKNGMRHHRMLTIKARTVNAVTPATPIDAARVPIVVSKFRFDRINKLFT